MCASIDTLSRFIQYKSSHSESPLCNLNHHSFTVVSADNIDFVHKFARVHSGTQNISWHGTTVQDVQPQPLLENILSENTLLGCDPPKNGHPPLETGHPDRPENGNPPPEIRDPLLRLETLTLPRVGTLTLHKAPLSGSTPPDWPMNSWNSLFGYFCI